MKKKLPLLETFDPVNESVDWRGLSEPSRDPVIVRAFMDDMGMRPDKYTIEADGSVTYHQFHGFVEIELIGEPIKCFPVHLNDAVGPIRIKNCPNFSSLLGLPKRMNKLTLKNLPNLKSLEHCPTHVHGFLWLSTLPGITSLEGFPIHVRHGFTVHTLPNIKNLRGMEMYGSDPQYKSAGGNFFECGIESLEGLPREMAGGLTVKKCRLKTLKGAPNKVKGRFDVSDNQLTSLRYHPKYIWDSFVFKGNPLKRGEVVKARKSIKKRW